MNAPEKIWQVVSPSSWPEPPSPMSWTALSELEACPRRWALSNAEYPAVWSGQGYPPTPTMALLRGRVTHLALARAVASLVAEGCVSLSEGAATAALRKLGGLTKLVSDCVDAVLGGVGENPRMAGRMGDLETYFTGDLPTIREELRFCLQSVRLAPRTSTLRSTSGSTSALGEGSYSEVRLTSAELGWTGVADLVCISSGRCEIAEFKTGEQREDHALQLLAYAVLWSLDRERNPLQIPVSELVLQYSSGARIVDHPTQSDLERAELELRERTRVVKDTLGVAPPVASPDPLLCRYCSVRHLCDEYWSSPLRPAAGAPQHIDLQVRLISRLSPSYWRAELEAGGCGALGDIVRICVPREASSVGAGQRLRVLSARIVDPDASQASYKAGSTTECFALGAVSQH